jgi:hypothetical protein
MRPSKEQIKGIILFYLGYFTKKTPVWLELRGYFTKLVVTGWRELHRTTPSKPTDW